MTPEMRKTWRWKSILDLAAVVALLLVLLSPSLAGGVTLLIVDGSTVSVPPSLIYDGEVIGFTGQGTLKQTGGTNTVNFYLGLGNTATAKGTYILQGGSLLVNGEEDIGIYGTGRFTQTGGTHTVKQDLTLGYQSTGTGTYDLKGGSLSVDGFEYVGNSGIGTFTQIGGSHTVTNGLNLGEQTTGNGTYNLYGGNLQVDGTEILGFLGTGLFDQWGGQHKVAGAFDLGLAYNSSGTYHLKGGSLQVGGNEIIGLSGTGSFVQTGGQHTIVSAPGFFSLLLGANGGSSGTYNLKSGTLAVGTDEIVGKFGTGVFDQSGGKNMVAGNLTLGGGDTIHGRGSGTYNLKFGSLAVGTDEIVGEFGTGVFDQSGGKHTVAGNLNLGLNGGSSGTYNLKFGTLAVGGDLTIGLQGTGTLNQWGGSLQVDGDEYLGIAGPGIVNQSGGQHTVGKSLLVGQGGTGTYNLTGGKLSAGAIKVTTNNGTFNVMNTITTVNANVAVDDGGRVNTTKAAVTWNGDFSIGINNGSYNSDHAKQTFTDLNVMGLGFLTAASQDVFSIKNDFNNQSANTTDWNTAAATLQFINNGLDRNHIFSIAGADNGPSGPPNPFAWGTLSILGQTVHLLDGDAIPGGALYVGGLIGAQVNWFTKMVYNIFNDDSSEINVYYDPDLLVNAYLLGKTYDLAGPGGGQLIPDPAPLPPSVFLLGSGLLGLGLLGWRRKRLMG
jgi:hypothetical protein